MLSLSQSINMIISIVVAVSKNNVIGKDNQLLWKLSDDLKRFKKLTTNHCIVMGRKTYDSIGKALPNRTNIIITKNKNFHVDDAIILHNIQDVIEYAKSKNETELFIIGGGEIYKQALEITNKIYLTKVDVDIDGDTFFHYNTQEWRICYEELIAKNEKNEYDSTYQELERI
jgi:dihydrofolate reductase